MIEPGLTGVVGPNGCGKSNIVEALRWVMGESSARGLRGAEMDEVIFNGSATRPAFDVAEARLRLAGRVGGLPFLGEVDELEVARRIARGQGSIYRVNGREVRARDVQLLFADAGAGARSPAIVGQGQIGFIVDARPEERRRLLEDAAGIGGLHGRRREAEAKLRETAVNLQRVLDLAQAQESGLRDLERQDREAERYRQVSAELREVEGLLLLVKLHAASAAHERAVVAATEASARDAAAQAALHATGMAHAALLERQAGLRVTVGEYGARLAALDERRASLVAAEAQRRAYRGALRRAHEEALGDAKLVDAALASALAQRETLAAEIGALAAERPVVERSAPSRHEAMVAAAQRLEAARAAYEIEQVAVAGLARDQAHARLILAEHSTRAAALRQELAALHKPPSDPMPEPRTDMAGDEVDGARATLAAAEDRLAAAEAAVGLRRAEITPLATRVDEARDRLAVAQARQREREAAARLQVQRAADHERRRSRLAERQVALAARHQAHRAAQSDLDAEAAGRLLERADAELQQADERLDRVRVALHEEEATAAAATARRRDLERTSEALVTEARLLEGLGGEASAGAAFRQMTVPGHLERAVAAVFGDDLLASLEPHMAARWVEVGRAGDLPTLPSDARPLAELVEAPPALALALRHVGLVAGETGDALHALLRPGQALVSENGAVWRWDGLVRGPDTEAPSAARLRHALRRDAIAAELEALRAALETAALEVDRAATRLDATRAATAEADQAWRMADAGQMQARQRAIALDERRRALAAEAAALAVDSAALEAEAAELAAASSVGMEPDDEAEVAAASRAAEADLAVASQARTCAEESARVAGDERRAAAELARAARSALDAAVALTMRRQAERERAAQETAAIEARRQAREETILAELERLAIASAAGERAHQAAEVDAAQAAARLAATEGELKHASVAHDSATAEIAALDRRANELTRAAEQAAMAYAALEAKAAEAGRRLTAASARAERSAAELAELTTDGDEAAKAGQLAAEIAADEARLAELSLVLTRVDGELQRLTDQRDGLEEAAFTAREAATRARSTLERAADERHEAEAAAATRPSRPLEGVPVTPETVIAAADVGELAARCARLRASRDRIGPVNLRAAIEAAELRAAVAATRAEADELRAATARLEQAVARLNREGRERLAAVFEVVDRHFGILFARLFGGGRARLSWVGAADPLTAGLELEASPPGKRLGSIGLLSGGEKTLTALALVFAFFLSNPSPLCVLDEVDAPLDDANVERFVDLTQAIAAEARTRFLIVTHHPLTMARMDRLYGVTMSERGVSRLVSVTLQDAIATSADG